MKNLPSLFMLLDDRVVSKWIRGRVFDLHSPGRKDKKKNHYWIVCRKKELIFIEVIIYILNWIGSILWYYLQCEWKQTIRILILYHMFKIKKGKSIQTEIVTSFDCIINFLFIFFPLLKSKNVDRQKKTGPINRKIKTIFSDANAHQI